MALFIPVVNSLSKLLQVDEEDYGIMAMKKKNASFYANSIWEL